MNELVTPPGYAEYPRDPKFKPIDDIGRFELTANGYEDMRWAMAFLGFVCLPFGHEDWRILVPQALLAAFMGVRFKVGLTKIFRGQGWPEAIVYLLAPVPGIPVFYHVLGASSLWPVLFGWVACAVPVLIAERAAVVAYRKVGLSRPTSGMNRRKIELLVAELRARDAAGPLVPEPTPDKVIGLTLEDLDSLGRTAVSFGERLSRWRTSRGA